MSEVTYYKGLTIETDASAPRLMIEGRHVEVRKVNGNFRSAELPDGMSATILELAHKIVHQSPERERRDKVSRQHVSILAQGVEHWNTWRRANPEIRPLLYDMKLPPHAPLDNANLANAVLIQAQLPEAELRGANFHEANLGGAVLRGAHFNGANFCRTDLYETDLSTADLTDANLQGCQLAKTVLEGATLANCTIYGLSAWDLRLDNAVQRDLTVLYRNANAESENRFIVNDLRYAQFVYSLLNNPNISNAVDAMTSKLVLILGAFSENRKPTLNALREKLQGGYQFVPVVFDFDRPRDRTVTETVELLARAARFVVADLTDPRSVPFELGIIANVKVPVQPIITDTDDPFSMLLDLGVLPAYRYQNKEQLLAELEQRVIDPAEAKLKELHPQTTTLAG